MKIFLMSVLIVLSSFSFAQSVKKVKIDELADYINKSDRPLVINFWATWCSPCTHELPYFQTNIKKYSDQKIELVLVSLDFKGDYPKRVQDFIKKEKYSGSFYWLDETNADLFCPKIDPKWDGGIPATLFINNKNSYRNFFERQLTEPQFINELRKLIGS